MKSLKSGLLSVILVTAFATQAQETKQLSLKECIDFTLKNHPSTLVYGNNVKIAEHQRTEALSGYMPQVNASGAFDDNIKRQVTVIPAGAFSPTDQRIQFGNQYNTSVVLQADQVIYDQALLAGLKANKPNMELAELRLKQNEDNLIYSTAYAYYQALIYKEQLNLLEDNEKKLKDLLAVQKLQLEKGVITRVSYNRVQVNYNNVVTQKKVAQTSYELSLAKLKNAMGLTVEQPLAIVDSINYSQVIEEPQAAAMDIRSKPDYQILEKNIVLQEIDLKRKRASTIPTISAYGRYGASAFGNEFTKAYDNWFDFSAVGVKLNVPIFSGLRRHSQIKQSELNLYNSRQNLVLNSESIKTQLQSAQTQLVSAYSNLKANQENIELAKTVFDDTSLQYEKGTVTLTDFLNADFAYKEAQANYINALLYYLSGRIDLERSKGTIKEFVNQL